MNIINPQRMREGYCSCSLCVYVCICVSITKLAVTYLVYTLKTRCHYASHGIFKICIVWILLKTLCSKVLATFANHHCLLRFLSSSPLMKETVITSFQEH